MQGIWIYRIRQLLSAAAYIVGGLGTMDFFVQLASDQNHWVRSVIMVVAENWKVFQVFLMLASIAGILYYERKINGMIFAEKRDAEHTLNEVKLLLSEVGYISTNLRTELDFHVQATKESAKQDIENLRWLIDTDLKPRIESLENLSANGGAAGMNRESQTP